MTDKGTRVQGPDNSITTERNSARVVVLVAGRFIVDAREAVTLCDASYAAVHCVPRKGVDMAALGRSAHATHAPYRGDCAYYCVPIGVRSINACGSTRHPIRPSPRYGKAAPSIANPYIPSRIG